MRAARRTEANPSPRRRAQLACWPRRRSCVLGGVREPHLPWRRGWHRGEFEEGPRGRPGLLASAAPAGGWLTLTTSGVQVNPPRTRASIVRTLRGPGAALRGRGPQQGKSAPRRGSGSAPRGGAAEHHHHAVPRADACRALAYAGPEDAAPLAPPHTGTAPTGIGRRSTPQETQYPFTLSTSAAAAAHRTTPSSYCGEGPAA